MNATDPTPHRVPPRGDGGPGRTRGRVQVAAVIALVASLAAAAFYVTTVTSDTPTSPDAVVVARPERDTTSGAGAGSAPAVIAPADTPASGPARSDARGPVHLGEAPGSSSGGTSSGGGASTIVSGPIGGIGQPGVGTGGTSSAAIGSDVGTPDGKIESVYWVATCTGGADSTWGFRWAMSFANGAVVVRTLTVDARRDSGERAITSDATWGQLPQTLHYMTTTSTCSAGG